jgi:hypothetical protein
LDSHELRNFSGYFPFKLSPDEEKEKVLIIRAFRYIFICILFSMGLRPGQRTSQKGNRTLKVIPFCVFG